MFGSLPCFSHISASRDVSPLRITLLIFLCRSINTLMLSNLMTLICELGRDRAGRIPWQTRIAKGSPLYLQYIDGKTETETTNVFMVWGATRAHSGFYCSRETAIHEIRVEPLEVSGPPNAIVRTGKVHCWCIR